VGNTHPEPWGTTSKDTGNDHSLGVWRRGGEGRPGATKKAPILSRPAEVIAVDEPKDREGVTRELFQAVAAASPDAVLLVADTGYITVWNAAAQRMFGLPADRATPPPPPLWQRFLSPEAQVRLAADSGSVGDDSPPLTLLRNDGEPFPAAVRISPLPAGGCIWVVRDLENRQDTVKLLEGAYERLERAHREWEAAFDAVRDPIFLHDAEGRIINANRAYAERAGVPITELRGRRYWDLFPKGDGPLPNCMHAVEHDMNQVVDEVTVDGSAYLSRAFVARDRHGAYRCSVHIMEDVTEKFEALGRIESISRLYTVLSEVNKAIVRVTDEQRLFEAICRIVVEQGQLQMAWVGLLDSERQELRPTMSYGHVGSYLDGFVISLANEAQAAGPTARSLVTEGHTICNDTATDPRMALWRDRALACGFRASAAFAFSDRHGLRGALTIYADRAGFFTEEVVQLFKGLAADISFALDAFATRRQRERAEADLRELNDTLEARILERTTELTAVNRELEAFSYSVSHDLRTPLRSLDGFSHLLLKRHGEVLDETGKDYLNRIRAASGRMGELIDDLLTLSRVTRAPLASKPVDLSAVATEILTHLAENEPERQVAVRVTGHITARCDAALARVLLENLLGNAWKFTGRTDDPSIEFTTERRGNEVLYCVRDNGVGFDMAYAGKLFGAFQRLHRVDEFPGTGIGLATAQRIVQRHGGQIWADALPGEGATFRFTLTQHAKRDPDGINSEQDTAAAAG